MRPWCIEGPCPPPRAIFHNNQRLQMHVLSRPCSNMPHECFALDGAAHYVLDAHTFMCPQVEIVRSRDTSVGSSLALPCVAMFFASPDFRSYHWR